MSSTASAKRKLIKLTLFKALLLPLLFFLSLVFICRENTRQSGILLFPDCPRFCRLMKTRNFRYFRSSGMDGKKSGESTAFPFSRRVPDFCDSRRSFPTNEIHIFPSRTAAMDFAHYQSPIWWAPVPLS